MNNGIERYLSQLKKELSGSDRATIQDALDGADPTVPEADALAAIVEKYGSPAEVAAAYKEIESRTPPAFTRPARKPPERPAEPAPAPAAAADTRPFYLRFFGVYADPRAWGALLYLLFALGTGIIYYTWAVTGLSLSLGLLVLIIGIPIAVLFLLSVRGIALVEGRIVEALLGIRMPRRPLFSRRDIGWWQKIKGLLASRLTWTSIIYMILQLPLGILYFSVTISLVALSVWLIGRPIFELTLGLPAFTISPYYYFTPEWVMPFSIIGGMLLLTLTMHLVKLTGRGHGRLAKAMLVRE